MNTTPTEIIHLIYTFLPRPDIKSLRQTCKIFSEIGEEVLFANFEFRLYPRIARLREFASLTTSRIANRLKCVSYESGILPEWQDYRLWEAAEFSRREAEFTRKHASKTILRDLYHVLRAELNDRFPPSLIEKYDQYRWWIDDQARRMSEIKIIPEIANCLRRVHWVQELKLIMKEPTIRLEDLEQGDEAYREYMSQKADRENLDEVDRSTEVSSRRNYATKHFCSLLQAALQLYTEGQPLCFTRFSTIDLPREILSSETLLPDQSSSDRIQGARVSKSFVLLFTPVTHLDLSISHFPHSDYLARSGPPLYTRGRDVGSLRLISLLNLSPTSLTQLSLSLPSSHNSEFSFALFDTTNLDRFPRTFLHRLTSFHLSNFTCVYADFSAFFSETSMPSLTHLSLHDGKLETGSLVWVFRLFASTKRPHSLVSFSISGEWSVADDDGKWHSRDERDYASCLDYEGAFPRHGLRQRIQEYVVGGAESCPLPVWGRDEGARSAWDDEGDGSFHYHPGGGAMGWSGRGRERYNAYFGVVPGDVP